MSNQVAIITGASRGIGPYIATAAVDAGYAVVLAARSRLLLEERALTIKAAGGLAVAVPADITDPTDRQAIVDAARDLGPISVLVNNAAVGPIRNFGDHTTTELADIVEVNLTGPMDLTRLVVNQMLAANTEGRIVNVATVAAKLAMPHMVAYSATKAALTQFSAALDLEYRDRGIRASTVLPGAVAEEGMAARAVEETGVNIPNDGAVRPEVVANAVVTAIKGDRLEVFVGTGSRFMTRHPRLAYRLMRRGGVLTALRQAADHYTNTAIAV